MLSHEIMVTLASTALSLKLHCLTNWKLGLLFAASKDTSCKVQVPHSTREGEAPLCSPQAWQEGDPQPKPQKGVAAAPARVCGAGAAPEVRPGNGHQSSERCGERETHGAFLSHISREWPF